LGVGGWGLGWWFGPQPPKPQTPNPQSPIPINKIKKYFNTIIIYNLNLIISN